MATMNTDLKPASLGKPQETTQPSVEVAGRLGGLQTRLAGNLDEIRAAQHIRYQVFHKCVEQDGSGLDADDYDAAFDHLLVIDDAATRNLGIVATQRLQTRMAESGSKGLYSSSRFDLEELMQRHHGKCFMELGRSCILPAYRGKRTMELLWHGTWDYARKRSVDVMFGCASFSTTDPETIVDELSFLHHIKPANGEWSVSTKPDNAFQIPEFTQDPFQARKLVRQLPPLIKGYLRLGARFSRDAIIDHEFGTTDILVVLPVSEISPRYIAHYGTNADRHSATRNKA